VGRLVHKISKGDEQDNTENWPSTGLALTIEAEPGCLPGTNCGPYLAEPSVPDLVNVS